MDDAARPLASSSAAAPSLRASRDRLDALEALERGFTLFRSTFSSEAWCYYVGTMPFVAAFLPIWVDNGQIRSSNGALFLQALLLSSAYLFREWLVGSYMQRVRARAFGTPAPKPVGVFAQAASLGTLLVWKLALTIAALAAAPTFVGSPWLYTASQFASLEARGDSSERHTLRGCIALSSQWFAGGLLLFLMLIPLWIAVWLNCFIVAILVPQLLHSILGLNTLLSTAMGIFSLLRSSAFWLALSAGAWLALDPVVKCSFIVVYQHLRSRREGDDLRGSLASLPREQRKKAQMIVAPLPGAKVAVGSLILLLALLAGIFLPAARAKQESPNPVSAQVPVDASRQAQIEKLRHALDHESQRAIYRWHDADHSSPPTWLDRQLEKISNALARLRDAIRDFFRRLWPRNLNLSSGNKSPGFSWKNLGWWLALVAIFTIACAAVLVWLRQQQQPAQVSVPMSVAPLPDLSESVIATTRSEDEWFELANRLQHEGELRLAVRAAYLGLLAGLARREWLTIRRDRTNREYLDEFVRRWRRRPQAAVDARAEIPEKLRSSVRGFDSVWYGHRALTPESVAAYQRAQQELLSHV